MATAHELRPAVPSTGGRVAMVLLTGMILAAVVGTALLFGPDHSIGYRLGPSTVEVSANLGVLDLGEHIDRENIASADVVDTRGAWRMQGTAMHDLCDGDWMHPTLGRVRMSTSCVPAGVVLHMADGGSPWVLTPADPEGFVRALQAGESGPFLAAPGPEAPPWWVLVRVGPVGLALLMAGLLIGSPAKLNYVVTDGVVEVKTLWGRRRVPLKGTTVTTGMPAGRRWRIFGIGMPGHQVGRYVIGGVSAQVYVSVPGHAVVLRPTGSGRMVVVSPADVEGFVAACVAAGASRA